MQNKLKTRFCPSPTGLMHLGNTRTALFSALFAQGQQGDFLLRIEDTDQSRSKVEFVQKLMEDLTWLGLAWQEGPEHDQGNGPYYQSKRQSIYDGYYQTLLDKKLAYPCFCSEQQLSITRKVQLSSGQPPRYPGTCRSLTTTEVNNKLAEGLKPTLRFNIPKNQIITFNDFVKGKQSFKSDDIGDFIIKRMDGTSPFMYCNAIDDALMGVTHVMRGEDHLTNTPRQIMLLQALALPTPQYAHFALIVGHDNSPLSKRHGSKSVNALREEGYLALAIVNYLARLGHSYDENNLLSVEQLAKQFNFSKLSKSPAKFDLAQLNFWQKEAVSQLSDSNIWEWMGIEVHSIVPTDKRTLFVETIRANITFPAEAKAWAMKLFDEKLTYSDENLAILRQVGESFIDGLQTAIIQFGDDYQAICEHLKMQLKIKGKALFQPLRIALTNDLHGPELAKIIILMGSEHIQKRLVQVKKLIG